MSIIGQLLPRVKGNNRPKAVSRKYPPYEGNCALRVKKSENRSDKEVIGRGRPKTVKAAIPSLFPDDRGQAFNLRASCRCYFFEILAQCKGHFSTHRNKLATAALIR